MASTGRIGLTLPMANVAKGIEAASGTLSGKRNRVLAEAIMTSDTRKKEIAVEFGCGRAEEIGGVCKRGGMIQPGMSHTGLRHATPLHATMLCFHHGRRSGGRCPEVRVGGGGRPELQPITVDGDMSTNDSTIIWRTGWPGTSGSRIWEARRAWHFRRR